jgi:hypothetical protein
MLGPMSLRVAFVIMILLAANPPAARAQELPPRIPLFVVDLHGAFARLPGDNQALADSRGIALGELPGPAFGADLALHVYPLRFRTITFGIGGQVIFARKHTTGLVAAGQTLLKPVTERFVSGAPQISFNFGNGTGWSYISGGIGQSVWQIIPDGADTLTSDTDRIKTINYGGGARWFMKKHLAFSFDVRIYAMNPGAPAVQATTGTTFPATPRTAVMVIGVGASIK